MTIYEKLMKIQKELKAPKGQWNDFSKFNYRSCEDILEAVKPLLAENELVILIADEVVNMGDRYYIKATAKLIDVKEPDNFIETSALAREALTKKNMDESQLTGSTSSYARKYCLNGLFAIDDAKDADNPTYPTYQQSYQQNTQPQPQQKKKINDTRVTVSQRRILVNTAKNLGIDNNEMVELLGSFGYESSSSVEKKDFDKILNEMEKRKKL